MRIVLYIRLVDAIERHMKRAGHYTKCARVDQIYGMSRNRKGYKERGIELYMMKGQASRQ